MILLNSNLLHCINIPTCINFKRFFNTTEFKWITRMCNHFSWPGKLFYKRNKFMMIAPIIVHFNLTNEFNFYTLMLQLTTWFFQADINLKRLFSSNHYRNKEVKTENLPTNTFPIIIQQQSLLFPIFCFNFSSFPYFLSI